MTRFSRPCTVLALTLTVGLFGAPSHALDLVTRTPNIASLKLADPGSVEFMFNHRIPSLTTISAFPTLTFDIGVLPWLSIYSTYGSKGYAAGPVGKSPVQGSHDLGISLRQAIMTQERGGLWADAPLTLILAEGASTIGLKSDKTSPWYSSYLTSNSSQQSLGLSLGRTWGPLGLIGTVRSVAYEYAFVDSKLINQTGIRSSGMLGATLKLTDGLTLAGDYGKYFDQLEGIPAWSAALQAKIPGSRHLFALEVSNVPTNTLGGTSQAGALNDLFVGFAFTANLPVSRWVGSLMKPAPTEEAQEESAAPEEMKTSSPATSAPVNPVAPPAGEAPAGQTPVAQASPGTDTPAPAATAAAPAPPAVDTAALAARGKKLFDSEAAGQGCSACHEAKDAAGWSVAKMKSAFKSDSMADFRKVKDADLKALEAYLKSVKK